MKTPPVEVLLNDYEKEFKSQYHEVIVKRWEALDQKLFIKNKNPNLISKGFASRTIWSPQFDLITFKRRRYINKLSKKTSYLLDEAIGLKPRKFILPSYRELALFYYRAFQSYKEIAEHVYHGRVSAMSIHRFIKEQDCPFKMKHYTCASEGILWINADGLWQKLHKSKKMAEIKNFAFYTGKELNCKNKWSLTGRVIKHFVNTNLPDMVLELKKIIAAFSNVQEIRLIGDGAKWIRKVAKEINAVFYIDKFHFRKALRDLVGVSRYHKALNIINQDLSKTLIRSKLLHLVADPFSGEINARQLKLIGYIFNSYEPYIRSVQHQSSNHIEALQAHYEAKFIKNRRKGFSPIILNKILTSLINWSNGLPELQIPLKNNFSFETSSNQTINNTPLLN